MGLQGQGSSSRGESQTGQTTSLSFIPSLLANAFFGTGIGLEEGGFTSTGTGDFSVTGSPKGGGQFGRVTSLIDPFGLENAFSPFQDPFTSISGNVFEDFDPLGGAFQNLVEPSASFGNFARLGSDSFESRFRDFQTALVEDRLGRAPTQGDTTVAAQGPGGPGAGGGPATGGILDPFDLVSNLMDLINPAINPGVQGALGGIAGGQLGQLFGNDLLFGEGGVGATLGEGLETGFKPDLQPVIDEASRQFFDEIVPQLGQSNVALQEGVGPFSSDLSAGLLREGGALASRLGALEVQNQNLAGDRRSQLLGISPLVTNTLFNAPIDAGRNQLNLGEQFAQQGTTAGRQSTLLQLLAGLQPSGPIQGSSASNAAKSSGGGASIICWVAAEYYPLGSNDWIRCRNWVLTHRWLCAVYTKYGERFAAFLRRHSMAHWLFRPVVKFAHHRGSL